MIYIKLKDNIKDRAKIAKQVSKLLFDERYDNIPYKTNDSSDEGWIIDSGNDWRLHFEDVPNIMCLSYRYQNNNKEILNKRAELLKKYFNAEYVEKP